MFDSVLDYLEARPLAPFEFYMDAVRSHPEYFTNVNFPDPPVPREDPFGGFFETRGPALPIGKDALAFLTQRAGLTQREVRLAGWASWSDLASRHYLLAPARHAETIIGVRALRLPFDASWWGSPHFRYDVSDSPFDIAPVFPLSVPDAPVPFQLQQFDASVFVSHDPVDALVLQSLGLNATSLAHPFETLGSREGLWQLQELRALTPRKRPRGTLVIVDGADGPTRAQAELLRGQFETVWAFPGISLGHVLWEMAREFHTSDWYGCDPFSFLGEALANLDSSYLLQASPKPLPSRDAWAGAGPPAPLPAFTPVSELAGEEQQDIHWLVEGFIASGTITQVLGGPKVGKSTLLLSMLAEVSRGGTFLGTRCRKSSVLYVTEQTRQSFTQSLKRSLPAGTSVADLPDLLTLTSDKIHGVGWAGLLTLVRQTALKTGARVVVFDTFAEVAGVHGDAENSAGAARQLYGSMRPLLSDGLAVVAVRHTRKSEHGGIAESGLGSVVNAGSADHLVRVRTVPNRPALRRIDTLGRLGDAEDFRVELTPSGWIRVDRAAPDELRQTAQTNGLRGQIVEALQSAGPAGLRRGDLLRALAASAAVGQSPPGRTKLDQVLKELVEDGGVAEERMPGTGSPRLFRLISGPTP